jgi:hypothetical protein
MTFEKALSLSKAGKFMKLDTWETDEYICLLVYKSEKMLVKVNKKEIVIYNPTQKDILSNGWQIAIDADTKLIKEDKFKLYKYQVACTFLEDNKVKYSIITVSLIKKIETKRDVEELKIIIAQMIPSMVYDLEILQVNLMEE